MGQKGISDIRYETDFIFGDLQTPIYNGVYMIFYNYGIKLWLLKY